MAELRLAKVERERAAAEKTIVSLVRGKKEVEARISQVEKKLERAEKELAVEVNRSTRRALERNELKAELAEAENRAVVAIAKAAEVEAGADKSFGDGYYLAQLHAAQYIPPDYDLSQVCGWNREEILAGAAGPSKVSPIAAAPPAGGDTASSSDPAGSDQKEPTKGEEGAREPPAESIEPPTDAQGRVREGDVVPVVLAQMPPVDPELPIDEPLSPAHDQ